MDTALTVAFTLRTIGVALLFASAVILAWAWATGRMQETLAYGVLRMARRSGLTVGLLLLTVCLGIGGLITAAMDAGAVSLDVAQVIGSVTFLAAALAALSLTWLGLSKRPQPPESQLVLDAPEPYLAAVGTIDRGGAERSDRGSSTAPSTASP